jgi:hypothetical protein
MLTAYEHGYFQGAMHFRGPATVAGVNASLPVFSHTFGFYISAIDDFYTVHSEAARVDAAEVVGCLADKPIYSCSELAQHSH